MSAFSAPRQSSTENVLWLDYKNITKVVEMGSKVYIDDGLISLQVQEIGSDYLMCEIENGGQQEGRQPARGGRRPARRLREGH
ncbi:hypothetical protein KOW79_003115 [Hemibagrus wyckioides]|uniref:Pyruvate kinase barrel domain-containing protein n=1 Tax=Hemibagrus wyckioides TaxID=337641 RepID=A0A9D3P1J7_9TELE|nr:hypothetical protein KOW79_003115 [Hemibagrus wyckioides]